MTAQSDPQPALMSEIAELRARLAKAETRLRMLNIGNQHASENGWNNPANAWQEAMLAQVSDAVIATDNDQRVTYLNAAAERQYGITATEAIGCLLSDLYQFRWLQPEDEQAAYAALNEKGEWRGENIHVRRDGMALRVESSVSILRDVAGNVNGLLAVIRNVDQSREIEAQLRKSNERLRQSEDRFRLASQAVQSVIYDWDLVADHVERSNELFNLLGFASDEAGIDSNAWYQSRIHPDDAQHAIDVLRHAIESNSARIEDEFRLQHKDGHYIWVRDCGIFLRNESGRAIRCVGSITNITNRHQAEDQLRASKQHLDALINQNISAIAEVDMTGRFMMVNDRYCELTSYSRNELLNGMRMQQITHPDDLPQNMIDFRRLAEEGIPFSIEKRYIRKDGSIVWVHNNVSAVYDAAGKRQSIVAVMEDISERRKSELALRESESRLSLALESGRMGAWEWDLVTGVEHWSPEQEKLFGLTPGKGTYPAEQFFKMVHPEDLNPIAAGSDKANAADGDFIEDEFRIIKPDGSVAWIASRSRVHRDASGRVVRLIGVNMDVTERKRAEVALKESEMRFRRLTEASVIGIIIADLEVITSANDEFLRMTGYSREDLEERRIDWKAMTPAEYAPLDQRGLVQLLEQGQTAPFEKEYIRKDGSRVPILLGAALLTREPLTWICFVVDLSERKRDEAKLQTANFRFRIAEEAANSFSYSWDFETGSIERSTGLQSVLGYAPDEMPGTYDAWVDLVHPDDNPPKSSTQAIYNLKHGVEDPFGFDYRARHKNGQYRWLYERGVLLRNARGEVNRVIGQVVDITDRKEAEEALRTSEARYRELNATLEARVAERTEALAQSREQLRELSAYIVRAREDERTRIAREVHDELGGALTVLKMSLARAARGHDDDAELGAQTQDMRAQIDELVKMVRRIASELRPSLLDDFGLIAAMEWQAQEWGQRTGIPCRLDVSLVPEDLDIDSDRRTALFRVFQESLTNVARHAHATRVSATMQLEGNQLVLTVQDNGQGIDATVHKAGKSLGLLGMRERVREVGGDFDIISTPGHGTTICVHVPLVGE